MLLIVPQIKGDNLEVQMNAAADKLKTEATAKVWTVTELRRAEQRPRPPQF